MNPTEKTSWVYWQFIKKIDPILDEPIDDAENYTWLRMNPADNLINLDDEYLSLLERMPEKERQRFLLGEFQDSSDGVVYYSFIRDKHVTPVKTYTGTIFAGMDFNVGMMSAVIGYYIDGAFYIMESIFLNDGSSDTYKMCDELKRRGYQGIRIIPDSTGKARKTSGKSDFEILKEAGFIIEKTSNPFVTDRVNNVNRLFTEDKIKIDPRCKSLIGDLEKVMWKNNKLDQTGDNKDRTHVSDCLGYMCWKLEPIISQKKSRSIQL